MSHVFLSDEWIGAMLALLDEYRDQVPEGSLPSARANIIVDQVPFGDGRVRLSADTTLGAPAVAVGHLPDPDITVTVAYAIARDAMVKQSPEELAKAWLMGKIKIDGDLLKLLPAGDPMALVAKANTAVDNPLIAELSARVRAATAAH